MTELLKLSSYLHVIFFELSQSDNPCKEIMLTVWGNLSVITFYEKIKLPKIALKFYLVQNIIFPTFIGTISLR